MRDLMRRLRALEARPQPDRPPEPLWHLLTDEDHELLATLPKKPDGSWDMEAWTDEQLEATRVICLKAAGEPA